MSKTQVLVIESYNKKLLFTVGDKVYELKELQRNKKYSEKFDGIIQTPAPKKEKIHPTDGSSLESDFVSKTI